MKTLFSALLVSTFLTLPAVAADTAAPSLNDIITATNFIVADQCSGTLISTKYKLILTNNHCLEGYVDKVSKDETQPDGTIESKDREVYKDMELKQKAYHNFKEVSSSSFQSKILFHSQKYDLALLQITADTIPQTIWSHVLPTDNTVARGDHVYVVGNPYLLDANLTSGVVSSTNRSLHWDETNEDVAYYGIDAGVNPGNSGGALYDANFNLIGVPGATIRGATGLGFAIPVETIHKFLAAHCYTDVYDDKAKSFNECMQAKFDKVNDARVKAGKPALDKPKDWNDEETLGGPGTAVHASISDLGVHPVKPAPVVAPPVAAPAPTFSHLMADWVKGWLAGE